VLGNVPTSGYVSVNMPFGAFEEWDVAILICWLMALGFVGVANCVRKQSMNGAVFLSLSDEHVKQRLGVKSRLIRLRIKCEVQKARNGKFDQPVLDALVKISARKAVVVGVRVRKKSVSTCMFVLLRFE